jgi:hypothetical protein
MGNSRGDTNQYYEKTAVLMRARLHCRSKPLAQMQVKIVNVGHELTLNVAHQLPDRADG